MTTAAVVCDLNTFGFGFDQAKSAVGHTSPSPKARGKDNCSQSYLYLVLGTPLQSSKTGEKVAQKAADFGVCLLCLLF